MKIKSYFAKSVDEAISQARVELGSEALLLNTRKISKQGEPAGYEVVWVWPTLARRILDHPNLALPTFVLRNNNP